MDITIINADITKLEVDVIVNSSDKFLTKGGGVSEAIYDAAGPKLEEECMKRKAELGIEHINIGDIFITHAYFLPCKYVFHTLGPVFGKDDTELLVRCYKNALEKADSMNMKSIAFPGISTGIFGVPVIESAKIVKKVLSEFKPVSLNQILFVFINDEDVKTYSQYIK